MDFVLNIWSVLKVYYYPEWVYCKGSIIPWPAKADREKLFYFCSNT